MKRQKIKAKRTELKLTQKMMADLLGISYDSYRKKETGVIEFSDNEKFRIGRILSLSQEQLDDYLFDGQFAQFK